MFMLMNKKLMFLCLLAFAVSMGPKKLYAQDDAAQVKACFLQYQEAMNRKDATAALKLFSSNSFSYYDSVLHLARFADSQQLAAQSLMRLVLALTLRARVPHAEIRVMTGTSLLQYAISNGMIGNVGQSGTAIGAVRINHDTAWASLLMDGTETELKLRFVREHQWTLDLAHLGDAGERGIEQMLREADVEREALIQMMLGRIFEGKVDPHVWLPIG